MEEQIKELKSNMLTILFVNLYMKDGSIQAFCNPVDVTDDSIVIADYEQDWEDNLTANYVPVEINLIKEIEIVRNCA